MSNEIEEIKCARCHGTGKVPCDICNGNGKLTCPDCGGKGETFSVCPDCHEGRVPDPRGADDDDTMPCPTCHGNYKTKTGKCRKCGGSGKVKCKTCSGSGKVECETCDGIGEFDADVFCQLYLGSGDMDLLDMDGDDDYDDLGLAYSNDNAIYNETTFALLEKLADAGNAIACFVVGSCYDKGAWAADDGRLILGNDGTKIADKDSAKAEKYYRICADRAASIQEDWEHLRRPLTIAAQKGLGRLLLAKDQSDARKREGVEWLQKAAENDSAWALLWMAFISVGGVSGLEGLEKNPEKALSYFKRYIECDAWGPETNKMVEAYIEKLPKAVAGDVSAMLELVELHEERYYDEWTEEWATGGYSDLKAYWLIEAINALSKIAKKDEKAKQQLDAIMLRCTETQSRLDKLKEVAKAGNVMAMKFLAKAYKDRIVGKDSEMSQKWVQMAADAGDAKSKLDLAEWHHKGCTEEDEDINNPFDINKAFIFAYEGFEAGHKKRASKILGALYRWHVYEYKKANELFAMAANAGNCDAIYYMGLSYLVGLGVKKNLREAKRLVALAHKKGCHKELGELAKRELCNVKPSKKPISGVMADGGSVKNPLPGFVKSDYAKAKKGTLWSKELEQKRKKTHAALVNRSLPSCWKRSTFILLGLTLGLFGVHYAYIRRWLMFIVQICLTGCAVARFVMPSLSHWISDLMMPMSVKLNEAGHLLLGFAVLFPMALAALLWCLVGALFIGRDGVGRKMMWFRKFWL